MMMVVVTQETMLMAMAMAWVVACNRHQA